MRITVFADNHGSLAALKKTAKRAKKADLVLCLGDFTIFEQNMRRLFKEISKMDKHIFILHGNHEDEKVLKKLCEKKKHVEFMHKKMKMINNILFIGYGGGGFSLTDKEFERFGKKIEKIIKKKKPKKTILMLHGPPYGTRLDRVMGEHCGNKSYKNFIVKNKINYVFAGHIHENSHKLEKKRKTVYVNPGPFGMSFEV